MEKLNLLNNSPEQEEETSVLGTTKDGKNVLISPGSHFHDEDGITYELVSKALSVIEAGDKSRIVSQVVFDRPIGIDKCVETTPEDDVIMVFRKGRSGQTPMVRNRQPKETNKLQVIIKQDRRNPEYYYLATTYAGENAPREPWDPTLKTAEEKRESEDFWNKHALIYNEDLIDWDRQNGHTA